MTKSSRFAAPFVAATTIAALEMMAHGLEHRQALQVDEFLALLLISALASRLKLKLPGMDSNMSVNLPFLLLAVIRLSLFEALLVALVGGVQHRGRHGGSRGEGREAELWIGRENALADLAGLIHLAERDE